MEENGQIVRTQKNGNRRSLYVSLTPQSKIVALKVMDIFKDVATYATSQLNEEDEKTLGDLLNKICMTMENKGDLYEKKNQSSS